MPSVLPGTFPAIPELDMRATIKSLRVRAGVGPSGYRNEYMLAWLGSFDDTVADRIVPAFSRFATSLVRVQLPAWYYSAAQE